MTFSETELDLKEIDLEGYNQYSASLVKSFFPTDDLRPSAVIPKEHRLKLYIEVINDYVAQEDMPRKEKIFWINLLDKLVLQHEILEIKKNPEKLKEVLKASRHLSKKMQSSFSD